MSNQRAVTGWIHQKQLRLPNVIFELLKPPSHYPPTQHIMIVPMNYNKIQIANYLHQVYNVKPISVDTEIVYGGKRPNPYNPRWKLAVKDVKKAYVTVSDVDAFTYPSLEEQRILGNASDSKT